MENEEASKVEEEHLEQEPEQDAADESVEDVKEQGGEQEAEASYVDILGEDVPEWMDTFDARGDGDVKITKEELDALPLEARRVVHALRRQAKSRDEAQAEAAKAAAEASKAADEAKQDVAHEQVALFDIFKSDEVKKFLELAKKVEDGDVDFSSLTTEDKVEVLVASKMKPLLESITSTAAAKQEDLAKEKRRREIKSFGDQNDGFWESREQIAEMVKTQGVGAETAYYILKGQGNLATNEERPDAFVKSRARAQAASSPGGSGAKALTIDSLKGKSAREKMRILEGNPELRAQLLKQFG